jgi:hypothetical protein
MSTKSRFSIVFILVGIFLVFSVLTANGAYTVFAVVMLAALGAIVLWMRWQANWEKSHQRILPAGSPMGAPAPPPPPDTTLVKCKSCGVFQPYAPNCKHCGAPLPQPT